jgi:hypothetical protein
LGKGKASAIRNADSDSSGGDNDGVADGSSDLDADLQARGHAGTGGDGTFSPKELWFFFELSPGHFIPLPRDVSLSGHRLQDGDRLIVQEAVGTPLTDTLDSIVPGWALATDYFREAHGFRLPDWRYTVLHLAALNGQPDTVRALLQRHTEWATGGGASGECEGGAGGYGYDYDPRAVDAFGESALDLVGIHVLL